MLNEKNLKTAACLLIHDNASFCDQALEIAWLHTPHHNHPPGFQTICNLRDDIYDCIFAAICSSTFSGQCGSERKSSGLDRGRRHSHRRHRRRLRDGVQRLAEGETVSRPSEQDRGRTALQRHPRVQRHPTTRQGDRRWRYLPS